MFPSLFKKIGFRVPTFFGLCPGSAFGRLFGTFGELFGTPWAPMGVILDPWAPLCAPLAPPWRLLVPSGAHFGTLGHFFVKCVCFFVNFVSGTHLGTLTGDSFMDFG